jgi:hypothetical protein
VCNLKESKIIEKMESAKKNVKATVSSINFQILWKGYKNFVRLSNTCRFTDKERLIGGIIIWNFDFSFLV